RRLLRRLGAILLGALAAPLGRLQALLEIGHSPLGVALLVVEARGREPGVVQLLLDLRASLLLVRALHLERLGSLRETRAQGLALGVRRVELEGVARPRLVQLG